MRDYYQLLGVDRRASRQTLRRAFRRCLLRVHPDHNPADANAPERTREVVEAYRMLIDDLNRSAYDRSLAQRETRWTTAEAYHPHKRRLAAVLAAAVLVLIVAALMISGGSDEPPVYRFDVSNLETTPNVVPEFRVALPTMANPAEWYQTAFCEAATGSSWVRTETARTYAAAADQAASRLDLASEAFYRMAIKELVGPGPGLAAVLAASHEPV